MKTTQRLFLSASLLVALGTFSSCDRYHKKTTIDEVQMAKQPEIYGEGEKAKQTANKYPDNPNLIELQEKTKIALYGKVWGIKNTFEPMPTVPDGPTTDTTATVADSTSTDTTAKN